MRRSVRLIRMYSRISYDLIRNILRLNKLCKSETRIDGKVVIITGANSGIGKETAYQLSLRGAKVYNHPLEGDSHLTVSQVIMACRDVDKADKAKEDILFRNENAELVVAHLDLSSLDSVRNFAQLVDQNEKKVDILINNAGVMMCPESKTADGHEMQFGTNYLGQYIKCRLSSIGIIFNRRAFPVDSSAAEETETIAALKSYQYIISSIHRRKNPFQ